MSFVERKIIVAITLAAQTDGGGNTMQPTFGRSGGNTLTLGGELKASVKLVKAGGNSLCQAQVALYGMTLSQMNQLSTLGMQVQLVPRNLISIMAGDASGMSLVFQGNVTNAFADFAGSPSVAFRINAHTLGADAVDSPDAKGYTGATDVVQIMSDFAAKMGLAFENHGVSGQLASPYLHGSTLDQVQSVVNASGFDWNLGDNGTMAIWPRGTSRAGGIPKIGPSNGLVLYPMYTANGISFKCEFNPSIMFGGKVQIESSLIPARGIWAVYGLNSSLESQTPGGQWFSEVQAYNPAFPPPVQL